MKEAILYERLRDNKTQCGICLRRCIIADGDKGYCNTRLNQGGALYTLTYGEVSTFSRAPIEKKPLFHFYPGSFAMSFGSIGCNFHCPGCQNWDISFAQVSKEPKETIYISPEQSIKLSFQNECQGISWTYNEPTLWFEYTLDGANLAKEKGLYTNYVTNGSITKEALDLIGPYLDAFRVDIKGFTKKTYTRICHLKDFEKILDVTIRAKEKWGMHIEVVTNVIPTYNDDKEELRDIAKWIKETLGPNIPWHVTRFYPHLDLYNLSPTPIKTLEMVHKIGQAEGLNYVYLGNVPGHSAENTYCHSCNTLLIERGAFTIIQNNIKNGTCTNCNTKIPGRF